ncbi:right-handed parallel beta-helix repeat-containing protein [Methylomonas sp. ZR1]|uniref:right-handed parallel beta-helix repeat-containing protein n=1 Tax=Methylomonas sp. ZR1 TaxID=1797072 RepID=UPI0014911B30|nr:right-handed parallel beta-helix repeat-containing protein [Methylomonas sp. ZR1]NOV31552.1 right-handed parallel beta-helix repeat-containing protein [Methylomonas sp. ZR1]
MFIKLVITLTFATLCSAAAAKDYYVSPSGSDSLNGLSPSINFWTKTGPFKTLTRARNAIRQLKAAGKFNEAITVHVGRGTYQLQAPLELNDNDSGFLGQEITWQGEKGATFITGAINLNCQPFDPQTPRKILSCSVNNDALANIKSESLKRLAGNAPVFELFVDGIKMQLARWPDSDWAHIRLPLTDNTSFTVFEKLPLFTGDLSNAQIHTLPGSDYYDQYIGVSQINFANNQIDLASETTQKISSGRLFYLENFQSALNTPKEWFYDIANSQIKFIAPEASLAKQVLISSIPTLLKIYSANYLNFRNITFQHSTSTAITLTYAENVVFDNLEIRNVGGKAIEGYATNNITVTNNHLHDAGRGGVLLYGGDRPTLQASGNLIHNNIFHDYDTVLYNYAPAIEIGGVAATVSHNLVKNAFGNGIVMAGNDHLVEKNEITNICQKSGDCGSIYASGRDLTYRGSIIRYNYVHDVTGYMLNGVTLNIANNIIQYMNEGARGIYLDDAVSGQTVYGNILVNSGYIDIQLGGGRDNRIENNVIKTNKYAILVDQRGAYFAWSALKNSLSTMPINTAIWREKYPKLGAPINNEKWAEGNSIQHNIVISGKADGRSLQYTLPKATNTIGSNLVWHTARNFKVDYKILDAATAKGAALWTDWINQGIEWGSLYVDPCLDISGSTINFTCTESPVSKIGFKPIPIDIGLLQ